jgi:hypothetical protein
VEEGFVYARLFGDLLHSSPGGASSDEHGVRGIEDALFGIAVASDGALTLWFNHSL